MKEWLRSKLRKWLGVKENYNLHGQNYSSIFLMKERMQKLERKVKACKLPQENIENINKTISDLSQTRMNIENLVDHFQLGVDVHPHGDSWAVFCIGGKMEYVRFVKLPQKDIMSLNSFIKQFPASRDDKFLDLPHGMRKEFFKF